MSNYKDYPLSRDTSAESEELFFKLLSKKSGAEKLRMMCEMTAAVRSLTMIGLRSRHPDDSEAQLKVRMAELLYGAEVAARIRDRLLLDESAEDSVVKK